MCLLEGHLHLQGYCFGGHVHVFCISDFTAITVAYHVVLSEGKVTYKFTKEWSFALCFRTLQQKTVIRNYTHVSKQALLCLLWSDRCLEVCNVLQLIVI